MGKGEATQEQLNNPLHGVKLQQILEHLEGTLGWEEMGEITGINVFKFRPTINSSLRFLRSTDWARKKVEDLYLDTIEVKVHISVINMWDAFIAENQEFKEAYLPDSWHFCDNEKDAKETAQLTVDGVKQATSSSLWWFNKNNESLPEIGDIYIVTDWYRIAKAIIRTTKIEQVPFNQITEEYAAIEGEGDKSLKYWKEVHWKYYSREMKEFDEKPTEDMVIVCEHFETIWK